MVVRSDLKSESRTEAGWMTLGAIQVIEDAQSFRLPGKRLFTWFWLDAVLSQLVILQPSLWKSFSSFRSFETT